MNEPSGTMQNNSSYDYNATVIIPVFNQKHYTEKCLEALFKTITDNTEVIVVNNGSEESTSEILEIFLIKHKNFKVINNNRNLGFAIACNQGIKESKGKYPILLNNDTIPTTGWLENMIAEVENNVHVGIVGACLLYPDSNLIQHVWVNIGTEDGKTIAPYHAHRLANLKDFPEAQESRECSAITGACMLINRELINKIGLLDEDYKNGLEDIDYCFNATANGFKIRYSAKSILYHFESVTDKRHEKDMLNWQKLNIKWMGKVEFDEAQSETISHVVQIEDREAHILRNTESIDKIPNLFSETTLKDEINPVEYSIIIPVHNNLNFTKTCLEGIWQTAGDNNYEIIIIDNASTDGTAEYLVSLGDKVKVITNIENLNYAKVNNQGAAQATGKYLIFLNNDTNPFPGWLEAIGKEFEEHPDTGIQGAKLLYENGSVQHVGMVWGSRPGRPEEPYHAYLTANPALPFVSYRRQVQFVTGACLAIRKELFDEIDGFDEEYIFGWEDSDLCMEVNNKGFKTIFNPDIVLYHYESMTKKIRESQGDDLMEIDCPREFNNRDRFHHKWGKLIKKDADDYFAQDGFRIDGNRIVPIEIPTIQTLENDLEKIDNIVNHETKIFQNKNFDKLSNLLIKINESAESNDILNKIISLRNQFPHLNLTISGSEELSQIFTDNTHIQDYVLADSMDEFTIEALADLVIDYSDLSALVERLPNKMPEAKKGNLPDSYINEVLLENKFVEEDLSIFKFESQETQSQKLNTNRNKNKILFTMFGWNESGGGTTFPKALAQRLVEAGWDVAVFFAGGFHPTQKSAYYLEETIDNGVRLYGLYNRPTIFLDAEAPEREIRDSEVTELFSLVLEREKPDLVHFHNFLGLSFAIAEEVKHRDIPSVYTPHNYHLIDPKLYMFHPDLTLWSGTDFFVNSELAGLSKEKDNAYKRRIFAAQNILNFLVDYTIAVSSRQAQLLKEFGGNPEKIAIVHQANKIVDELREKIVQPKDTLNSPIRIGYIGGVMPHKGAHNLVLAAQTLDSQKAEVHIYGFVNEDYRFQMLKFDKKNIVNWRGNYNIEDLPSIASELDFMVVPSVWEDCAPLVVLEAFAMGLPVVGAKIGGIPDFVIDKFNGRLYKYDSIEELSLILNELINNPNEILRLRKNIDRNFGFRTYYEHIQTIYKKLIGHEKTNAVELSLFYKESSKPENMIGQISLQTDEKSPEETVETMNRITLDKDVYGGFANKKATTKMPPTLPSPLLLNLGCGQDVKEGFINIDLFSDDTRVVGMDIRNLVLPDNCADFILASDVLEHFSHRQVDAVLKEWARVLKPGGEIVIRCPSLKLQAKAYSSGIWNADVASYMIFGGQTNPGDYHCNGFDEASIKIHLTNVGLEVNFFEEIDTPQDKGFINLNMTVRAKKPNINNNTLTAEINKITNNTFSQEKEKPMENGENSNTNEFTSGFNFDFGESAFPEPDISKDEQISDRIKTKAQLNIVWEGSQFVWHSLALINREHCSNLIDTGVAEVTIVPYEKDKFSPIGNPKYEKLYENDVRYKKQPEESIVKLPYVWIRHQWPPQPAPPPGAKWIIMQPWEYSVLREDFADIFKQADEVWTPSNFSRQSFVNSGVDFDKVQIIPNGVDPELFTPFGDKYFIPTKKKLIFIYVGGTIFRKGIDILLHAYLKSFTDKDNVALFIKDMGGDSFYRGQTAKEQIGKIKQQAGTPEIHYYDEYMTEEQIANLYRSCHVFICPYRGEGFSLPTLEAMACGLPVVVTKGGATDDFVDEEVGWLVSSKKRSIGTRLGNFNFTGEAFVLEPEVEELISIMKDIYFNPSLIFNKGLKGSYRARTQWTWKRATMKILARLDAMSNTDMAKKAQDILVTQEDGCTVLGKADAEFDARRFKQAMELYNEALGFNNLPEKYYLHALHKLTLLHLHFKDIPFAIAHYEKAESMNKDCPDNKYIRAKIHAIHGEWTESLELLSVILDNWSSWKYETTLDISLDTLLCDTAEGLFELNDVENALRLYTEALKMNNYNPAACYGAARCYLQADAKEDAKRMLKFAIDYDPNFEDAIKLLNTL
ncbi:MAG: glycosyltransferase [FCB group bacterium]|jgi:GT2 family glycosyltransferase/glycosyltransferase involved in cell wall biosynthesis/SAM-dependent methyltransferase